MTVDCFYGRDLTELCFGNVYRSEKRHDGIRTISREIVSDVCGEIRLDVTGIYNGNGSVVVVNTVTNDNREV